MAAGSNTTWGPRPLRSVTCRRKNGNLRATGRRLISRSRISMPLWARSVPATQNSGLNRSRVPSVEWCSSRIRTGTPSSYISDTPCKPSKPMSILVDKNTRLLVQGITGSSGAFHAKGCMEYGTNVVAGVTPGKGGQMFEGKVPVFDTVYEARKQTGCNATMIFVPAAFAADAILEAADAGVELIVCISEGIPVT